MAIPSAPPDVEPTDTVSYGMLSPWDRGDLPPAPPSNWKTWIHLLGPGLLLAGASVGTGEWLFGPAVSAQYGGTLLWLATLSIVFQVFCNLEMMRYTLYCGEPVVVGYFRSWPGPALWTFVYLILEFSMVWPYNASNAAVPLATACLGHLPGADSVHLLGFTLSENHFVKLLGYMVFFVAFIPLIFGGAIYKMLERAMAAKLLIVLGYLIFLTAFMISLPSAKEVLVGFFKFGIIPLRADTVIAGRHFTLMERDEGKTFTIKGTMENADPSGAAGKAGSAESTGEGNPLVTEFSVDDGAKKTTYGLSGKKVPEELAARRNELVSRAASIVERGSAEGARGGFFVKDTKHGVTLTAEGRIDSKDGTWLPERLTVTEGDKTEEYARLDEVPAAAAARLRQLIEYRGLEQQSLWRYWRENGRLPDLDWGILAAFAAIAGAGNMTNTMFSNYARDKGWGMGAHVGAIPSAVGGRQITLSHVGMVFPLNATNMARWRGWMRHVIRDQFAIWMLCSVVGMALPCMMSLEFIRNAPVSGNRVAAMTADGIAARYPAYGYLLWPLSLVVGFLVLAPGQIIAGDQISRRWTDIIWNTSPSAKRMQGNQVKYVYYTILVIYGIWGVITLALFDPLMTAKIGAVLGNVALGFTALHALYVNRTFLPEPLRPNWFMQLGTACCGIFFLGISLLVFLY